MNVVIQPPSGTLTLNSGDPPTVRVVPTHRTSVPRVVLYIDFRSCERRLGHLIHGPPLAA